MYQPMLGCGGWHKAREMEIPKGSPCPPKVSRSLSTKPVTGTCFQSYSFFGGWGTGWGKAYLSKMLYETILD